MGVLQDVSVQLEPLAQRFFQLGTASQIGVALASVVALIIFVNVAQQILFKNPNEPPVVFHLLPWFGSTVIYGMDPPKFLQVNRTKVRCA
jgi:sterol 14-demethylase